MRHRRPLQERLELIEKALRDLQAARRFGGNRLMKPAAGPETSTQLAEEARLERSRHDLAEESLPTVKPFLTPASAS